MSNKRVKVRVKSKGAQVTAEARKQREASAPVRSTEHEEDEVFPPAPGSEIKAVEFKGGGGLLMGMRSGFKSAVGAGEQAKVQKKSGFVNTVFWILIIAAVALIFARGYR